MIDSKKYCQYCLPAIRKSHLELKVDYYFEKLRQLLFRPFGFLMPQNWKNPDVIWIGFLHFLKLMGQVEFVENPNPEQILNRSLILFAEARKQGIKVEAIKLFGTFKNEFRYRLGGKYYYFETNPLAKIWGSESLDEKILVKNRLQSRNLPVPEGRLFTSARRAIEYARRLGFPLVVKPNSGSLGQHATYPVLSEEALRAAIKIARDFRPDFIVERYLTGGNFRATVIGGEHVLVSQKEMPNVTGNGQSTIRQLIDKKNQDPRRGDHDKKNQSLFLIAATEEMIDSLGKRGLGLDSIIPKEQKLYLYDRYLPGSGFDIIDHTGRLHPQAKQSFLNAAAVLGAELVGFDFICQDPALPPSGQVFGIIEANSVPYIDMHAFPSEGDGQDVAKLVWDTVLAKSRDVI